METRRCEANGVQHQTRPSRWPLPRFFSAPEWRGGSLVQLEDTISTPKAEDIVLNQPWIFPFIKKFRDCVPSQFFAADAVLYLDQLYGGTLLIPMEEGDSKVSLAVNESKKDQVADWCFAGAVEE